MTNTECLVHAISLSRDHSCGDFLSQGLMPTHYRQIADLDSVSVRVRSYGTELYTHTNQRDVAVAEMTGLHTSEITGYNLQQNLLGLISFMNGQVTRRQKHNPELNLFWFILPDPVDKDCSVETLSSGVVRVNLLRGPVPDRGSLRIRYGCLYLNKSETLLPWERAEV